MSDSKRPRVDLGSFPFPLTKGSKEPPHLTWLRNHSNYMAVQGAFDYVKAVGVMLRGMLINLLVILPWVMALAIVLAAWDFFEPRPYLITRYVGIAFLGSIVLFSILTPVFRIIRHRYTTATGSDSTVGMRGRAEGWFGIFLVALIAAAAFETLPVVLDWVDSGYFTLPYLSAGAAVIAVVFAAAPRLLGQFGSGVTRALTFVVIGLLGSVVPVVVGVYGANLLLSSGWVDWTLWTVVAAGILPLVIIGAVALGFLLRAFHLRDAPGVLALVSGSVAVLAGLVVVDRWVADTFLIDTPEQYAQALDDETIVQLRAYAEENPLRSLRLLQSELDALPGVSDTPGQVRLIIADPALDSMVRGGFETTAFLNFGRFMMATDSALQRCAGTDECVRVRTDVNRVFEAADVIERLHSARHSNGELVSAVLALGPTMLDRLELARLRYPTLSAATGIDPVEDCLFGDTAPSEPGICDVIEMSETLGFRSERVQRELVTTAAIRLVDSPFYGSTEGMIVRGNTFWPKIIFAAIVVLQLGIFGWLTIDVNLTSIHGIYRDRLAHAFRVGKAPPEALATGLDADLKDLDLMGICHRNAGSTAPYHLINTALNLQGSRELGVRDRKADFFVFSKRFIGSGSTGYCRSEWMEYVFPQLDLATAMAISAAAASPNMGRATHPALVAVMALLNIRLGYWVPNPSSVTTRIAELRDDEPDHFDFDRVFEVERIDVVRRWDLLANGAERREAGALVGLAFSGGGIRSATLNLGITQALHRAGVFDQVDYLSTVSGGGYLGSSISSHMRGTAEGLEKVGDSHDDHIDLLDKRRSAGQLFRWRVRSGRLLDEILGRLDEKKAWVNVSDGGHIENLAGIELLRRGCRFIIVGDGEADPRHHFNGLATLIRTARIDLGVEIDIDTESLRLRPETGYCAEHWAIGRILYPDETRGYLLYLKASLTGDEDEVIRQYRADNPAFPHESTADQFFAEGQLEAYRSLGQHMGEKALARTHRGARLPEGMTLAEVERWFERLWEHRPSNTPLQRPVQQRRGPVALTPAERAAGYPESTA